MADAARDSDEIRDTLGQSKARARIRPNPTRRVRKRYGRERCKRRNVIERFFVAIERFRRAASRRDKKAENFPGFARLAALLLGHI